MVTKKPNRGQPFHGSNKVEGGALTGKTDTDYFYFICPKCDEDQMMRVLDYEIQMEGPPEAYPDEKPKQKRDFTLAFKIYCPTCKMKDFVKISNVGWQGGSLSSHL